jgi:hypothetical protein
MKRLQVGLPEPRVCDLSSFVHMMHFCIWNISLSYMCQFVFCMLLPGNSSVNTVQHVAIEDAVFSVGPTNMPIDWLDSDHVICVYCRTMSFPRLYNESREL